MRFLSIILALAILLAAAPGAEAQSDQRCFPETGFCIAGPIRSYWEANGGLPVFGYPIGPQQVETVEGTWSGPVQWFERDRLEDHGNKGLGVLAGRLGARALELRGAAAWPYGPPPADPTGCRWFGQTGQTACGTFLTYWERNGGLERFGYPLGPETDELIAGQVYTVQYFERRRMERHPEHAGTPYEIQLGLLGRDLAAALRAPSNAVRPDPGLTHLLVLSSDVNSENLNLVRVGRDGSSPTMVNADKRPQIWPQDPIAWAPDGSAIAFVDAHPPQQVRILSADGRSLRTLPIVLGPAQEAEAVDWSPDGAAMLLDISSQVRSPTDANRYDTVHSIARASLTGQLTPLGEGSQPRWSPDGSLILFERRATQSDIATILVMRADGSAVREVGVGYSPSWSPDSAHITFDTKDGYVTTVTTDGQPQGLIVAGRSPVWAPDGSRLAYIALNGDIMMANADGSDPRTVMRFGRDPTDRPLDQPFALYWSPDGAQLAFRTYQRFFSPAGVVNLDGSGLFWLSGGYLPPRWIKAPGA